ncbi:MAG: NAD(P)/FAD-dependent oxidoreductase [Steroidobacteraceae bacterium]
MTKKTARRDRELGMDRPISRRDFINGIALGATALVGAPGFASPLEQAQASMGAAQDQPAYYPPTLTGLRGSHPGSFEAAHALRDGPTSPAAIDSGEYYDLIVVGGGLSGLAAAHFYRAQAPASRILIIDNHDDFGGHAKRNEFKLQGRVHLLNGGTLEIDSPRPYSPIAAGLIEKLGIDVPALAKRTQDLKFYERLGLQSGVFFDRETFGADKLVVGLGTVPFDTLVAAAPLSARARRGIVQVETARIDYLPGLTPDEKKLRLSRISYEGFLRDVVGVDPAVLKYYHARTMGEWGIGADAVSALDCWAFDMPGFQGMHIAKGSIPRMGYTPAGYADTGGSYRLHFPDGNATLARLLVRNLLPHAVPGSTVEDVVTARVDYAQLDRPDAPVRLRLNSIAVRARNIDVGTAAGAAEITYLRAGVAHVARARRVILACYNVMIPYLCPELPGAQKDALHKLVKAPLVYTSVALRNWQAFERLKLFTVYAPGSYHSYFHLNPHVNLGRYRSVASPSEPMLVHMVRTPCQPGLPEHDQNRAGRAELLATSFETFERHIRDQLGRTLKAGGFDPASDITAITVNRWPHGYAPEYNPLFDPDVPSSERPHVLGRARFGRISIANSDSGGGAYSDVAIDQGHRAAMEALDLPA